MSDGRDIFYGVWLRPVGGTYMDVVPALCPEEVPPGSVLTGAPVIIGGPAQRPATRQTGQLRAVVIRVEVDSFSRLPMFIGSRMFHVDTSSPVVGIDWSVRGLFVDVVVKYADDSPMSRRALSRVVARRGATMLQSGVRVSEVYRGHELDAPRWPGERVVPTRRSTDTPRMPERGASRALKALMRRVTGNGG